MKEQNKTRHDLGRDQFVAEVLDNPPLSPQLMHDFKVRTQHNLEFINNFTDNGKVNSNGGKEYKGMKHFNADVAVERGFGAEGELLSLFKMG
ncbi:unnamed protein product [Sphagnum tenellum]